MFRRVITWVISFSLIFISLTPALAQDEPPQPDETDAGREAALHIDLLAHLGGSVMAVAVSGNYAYIGRGPRLAVIDVSTPAAPVEVGATAPLPEMITGVVVNGDYAFLSMENYGLRVIDISDPANPSLLSSFETPGDAKDIAHGWSGGHRYALIADGNYGLRRINVDDPAAPADAGAWTSWPAQNNNSYSLAVFNDYAYLADYQYGLRKIDISPVPPANPTLVSTYDSPGSAYGVAVAGNYAYLADSSALRTINITTNPISLVDTDSEVTSAMDVAVAGSNLYVTNYAGGFHIYSISTASNPSYTREVPWGTLHGYYALRVAASGNFAYVASDVGGLNIVDAATPASAEIVAQVLQYPGRPQNLTKNSNYVYIADYTNTLTVVNTADPASPNVAGHYYDGDFCRGVVISGNYAYLANGWSGLLVLDISDPANPAFVSREDSPGSSVIWDAALSGNTIFAVDGNASSFYAFDVSNPADIPVPNSLILSSFQRDISIRDHYAYLSTGSNVLIIDIQNPAAMSQVGTLAAGSANSTTIAGNYLYVANGNSGLSIYDIGSEASYAAAPHFVSSLDTPGYAQGIALYGYYAYVADRTSLQAINVSTPSSPTFATSYPADPAASPIPGNAQKVAADESGIYLTTDQGGLYILGSGQTVSGYVRDEGGNGLSGVTLTLFPDNRTTVSAGDGSYAFAAVQLGTKSIKPDNTTYSFIPVSQTVSVSTSDISDVNFVQSPVHLVAPEHNTYLPLPGKNVILDWDAVPGATKYKVRISTNNGASWKTAATRKASQTNYKLKVQQHKTYKWMIQVLTGGVWKESTVFTFTPPYPPAKPQLKLPANNAKNQPLKPTLRWKNPKAAWAVDHYLVQIKPAGGAWTDLATVAGGGSAIVDYALISDLLPNTSYQWRVNACNDLPDPNTQCSGWTAPRKFKTGS
jgi:hypothetical protein